ncbi:MAG: amino acid ABC transporter substrate-binding protein [Clostridium sp.]|uniref:amino acid ABC transporter substrate-binding protein n=1 Tax=Clostridium sp. TaxID=1506 RepID=UPI002910BF42|nr:amino acid ABC transporter substrate-binding protein [Clostridium sp.]MDU7337954.1 amino acid ABC transporter substrate-binding protein [Clostridium sp.]
MKKLLALFLALTVSVGITACGQGNQSASSAENKDESWSKIQKAGTLVLGLDDAFPPMGYKDTKTGEIIGFDIDLAKEVSKRLGVTLKLQPIDWNNKQAELDNGNVDCLWNGFSKTPERAKAMALSIPYMSNNQIILVKTNSTYHSLKDLSNKVVGVQSDSSAETALNAVENKEFKGSLKDIVKIDDYAKAILEIQNGTIDAISIDEIVARFYLNNQPDAFRILDNGGTPISLAAEDYVIGMRKNDMALKEKVDESLKEMAKDGTMKKISEKWFGEDVTTVDIK